MEAVFTAQRYAGMVYAMVVCLSICLCVHPHKPEFYQKG